MDEEKAEITPSRSRFWIRYRVQRRCTGSANLTWRWKIPYEVLRGSLLLAFLVFALPAFANGWGSGLNFVPLTKDAVATFESGDGVQLARKTPIFVQIVDGELQTWIHRPSERPWQRRVTIDRTALPDLLDGFFAYQSREFSVSVGLLEKEAILDSDPLVRSWKRILAAHSHLLSDPAKLDEATYLYRQAAEETGDGFQSSARYFIFRALLYGKKFSEARLELDAIDTNAVEENVLFSVYSEDPEFLMAWGLRGITDLGDAKTTLDQFVEAKIDFDDRERASTIEERAETCYQMALAMEELWQRFPDRFYDDADRSEEVRSLLELTFQTYPETEAAAKAYYRHVYFRQYWDFDGERIESETQERELMRDFLAKYPNSGPAAEAERRLAEAENFIASQNK